MPAPRDRDTAGGGEDAPVLPDVTEDERAIDWGESDRESERRDEEWYRRERPPHHE